jgi:PKD repeat protein
MRRKLTFAVLVISTLVAIGPILAPCSPFYAGGSSADSQGTCPPVQNTPFFTIVYGSVIVSDQDAPAGTVVEARNPRGDAVGCFVISDPGSYGAMYVYGEDTSVDPAIPGMRSGEDIVFYVDGNEATSDPDLTWSNDKELHQADLNVAEISLQAAFTASPTSGVAPLQVDFTNTSIGGYSASLWHFGDSTTSTLYAPSHIYTSQGTYAVALTVSGTGGTDTMTRTNYITAYEPVQANFTAVPTSGVAPLTVDFTNRSTGDYDTCTWDFGDSGVSSVCSDPSHEYASDGVYTVTLALKGLGGENALIRRSYITVCETVSADFIASPTSGTVPLTVAFTNTSIGDYTSSLWEFGDGVTSTHQCPTHTYTAVDVYTPSLTVSGLGGADILSRTSYISVTEDASPVAGFEAGPTSGQSPLTVQFTDLSSGTVDTWLWRFGDGITDTLENPTHTYTSRGAYTVTLNVRGPGGSDTLTKESYIAVSEGFDIFLPLVLRKQRV